MVWYSRYGKIIIGKDVCAYGKRSQYTFHTDLIHDTGTWLCPAEAFAYLRVSNIQTNHQVHFGQQCTCFMTGTS